MLCFESNRSVPCPETAIYPNVLLDSFSMFWLFMIVVAILVYMGIRRAKNNR